MDLSYGLGRFDAWAMPYALPYARFEIGWTYGYNDHQVQSQRAAAPKPSFESHYMLICGM